jgi:hypothetical protein
MLLILFDTQCESIKWFGAATIADLVPTISTPFVNDEAKREKYLYRVHALQEQSIILISKRIVSESLDVEGLRLHDQECIANRNGISASTSPEASATLITGGWKPGQDPAVLMLTSGSIDGAKLFPAQGKSLYHDTGPKHVFLD